MGKLLTIPSELSTDYDLVDSTLISKEREFLTEIGDEKEPLDFFPQVKIKRWNNEANFSLRLQNVGNHRSGTVSANQGKVTWSGGGLKMLFERKPTIYGTPGLDWSIEIPSRPLANQLRFSIITRGLSFHYQPHVVQYLPHETDPQPRPEHIKGSYAVYHAQMKTGGVRALDCPRDVFNNLNDPFWNTPRGQEMIAAGRGGSYKTGKAFNIYRPKAVDALGAEIWADIDINEVSGFLTIDIDNQWLNDATYPVMV